MRNVVLLVGTIDSDFEHQSSKKLSTVRFSVREFHAEFDETKNVFIQMQPNLFPIKAYNQLAKKIASKFKKGDRVVIKGEIRTLLSETSKLLNIEIVPTKIKHFIENSNLEGEL